jgi:hypothetical protein
LAVKQFGVFRPDYTPATNANIAATKWIMFSQRRAEEVSFPWLGTKNSDKIYANKVTAWYKSTGEDTAAVQITDFSNFTARCGEQVSISLRLLSYYIDVSYYNGLTRSFTYDTPCCDCDGDPCDTLDADAVQTMVDWFVNRINNENTVKRFVVAERIGTGASSILRVSGKALDQYGNPCDLIAYPYQYDRMYFYGFAYVGSPTTQDLQFYYDRCEQFADVTVTQRSSYPRGTSDQVLQMEKDYWSYQVDRFKDFSEDVRFNQAFVSYAEAGVTYDQYVLEFETPDKYTWASYVPQDERVIIFVPQGQTSTLETMLVTKFGAIENKSAPDISTTTTTSTSSSTTSTTTTVLTP